MATRIIEKKNEDDVLIWRINRNTKKGYYKVLAGSSQFNQCERIDIEGFDRLPSGFYANGYGLTAGGSAILREVFAKYGKKIKAKVMATGRNRIDARGRKVDVTLLHSDLTSINQTVRSIKSQRNEEVKTATLGFLGTKFSQFREFKGLAPKYAPGSLGEVLSQSGIENRLSNDDQEKLEEFIPEYLSNIAGTLKAKKKLKIVYDTLDAGKTLYLSKALAEFEKRLDADSANENVWQKFLSEHILLLRSSYGEVLEKESVSLRGKFPDFMLIDPYGYLDIYEIKKPRTPLLSLDRSRNNYYWSTELSKAISQTENYLYQAQRSSDTLMNDIRKSKRIDVNIVRPRGYIIAGRRSQLRTAKMQDDFRILNESLKNIDVILYDDLVTGLDAFAQSEE